MYTTFNIYESRDDFYRIHELEWPETYSLPLLWEFFQTSVISCHWHDRGTEQKAP